MLLMFVVSRMIQHYIIYKQLMRSDALLTRTVLKIKTLTTSANAESHIY